MEGNALGDLVDILVDLLPDQDGEEEKGRSPLAAALWIAGAVILVAVTVAIMMP
jgi:hypothetical protein